MKKNITRISRSKNAKKIVSFLKENKRTVLTLIIVGIFADSLFIKNSSDFLIFSILLLYLISIKMFKIKSVSTFLLCIVLSVVMTISYFLTEASIETEKTAVWFVLFLIVGVIQQWKE